MARHTAGAGLLYVNNKHIPKIWPLIADHEKDQTKFKDLVILVLTLFQQFDNY